MLSTCHGLNECAEIGFEYRKRLKEKDSFWLGLKLRNTAVFQKNDSKDQNEWRD